MAMQDAGQWTKIRWLAIKVCCIDALLFLQAPGVCNEADVHSNQEKQIPPGVTTSSEPEKLVALDAPKDSASVEGNSSSPLIPALPPMDILGSSATHLSACGHLQLLFSQLQYSTRR